MSSVAPYIWDPYMLQNQYPNHKKMPPIGLGTFRINERDTIMAVVDSALKSGYRLFDTAAVYRNERYLGEALRKYLPMYDLDREDIYITTKLSNADHSNRKGVAEAFKKSTQNLGFEPDLYLIHFPGSKRLYAKDKRNKTLRHEVWRGMVDLFDDGSVSAIGVSNFTIKHLEDLALEYHNDIPAINQVEYHPLYHDEALLQYCNKNSIVLQGYSSLGGTGNDASLLSHPIVKTVADNHCVRPAQVLLTWSLQKGVAVIPKSIKPCHIQENIDLTFKLTTEEVFKLDHLSEKPVKFAWDPTFVY